MITTNSYIEVIEQSRSRLNQFLKSQLGRYYSELSLIEILDLYGDFEICTDDTISFFDKGCMIRNEEDEWGSRFYSELNVELKTTLNNRYSVTQFIYDKEEYYSFECDDVAETNKCLEILKNYRKAEIKRYPEFMFDLAVFKV